MLPLFDFSSGWFYWKVNKLDFLCWLTSYIVTAFAGALAGLGAAIGLSLILFFLKNAFPRFTSVGLVDETKDLYKTADQYPNIVIPSGVEVIRVEAPLFFGNLPQLRSQIDRLIEDAEMDNKPFYALVLDLETATDFDGAVVKSMDDILLDLSDKNITLILSAPSKSIVLYLTRAHLLKKIGGSNLQATMSEALARAEQIVAAAASEGSSNPRTPESEEILNSAKSFGAKDLKGSSSNEITEAEDMA